MPTGSELLPRPPIKVKLIGMQTLKIIFWSLVALVVAFACMALGAGAWFAVFVARWAIYFLFIGVVIVGIGLAIYWVRRASRTVQRNIDDMLR